VVGHDEAGTLARVLEQALAAAGPADEVWFVDSASTDDSAQIAAALGVEVVSAPLGKGRAIATALERCRGGYLCLGDADLERSSENIALRLREAAIASDAEMVVGEVDLPPGRPRTVTPAIYRTLVGALFPEAERLELEKPLSGFRVLRAGVDVGALPPGFGVETHLNVHLAATGREVARCPVGDYCGRLRGALHVAAVGADVAGAILDLAELHGRIDPSARRRWDDWAEAVLAVIREQPEEGDYGEFMRRLDAAAERPLPVRGWHGD
jgi:glycosyltransferase involved in cell wall biosynthesis